MHVIIKSILLTFTISAGLAFSLRQVFGFWECFVALTILQFLIGFFYKNNKIQRDNSIIDNLRNNLEEVLEKQQVNVQCPCGKNTLEVIVFHNEEVIVECDKCNNTFKVIPEIQTQLITEPLNMEGIYNKLKEQQYNKV